MLASEEEDEPVSALYAGKHKQCLELQLLTDFISPQVDMIGVGSDSGEIILDETPNYVVCFDPLDGSSNVDAGIPTGTIIGKKRRWKVPVTLVVSGLFFNLTNVVL